MSKKQFVEVSYEAVMELCATIGHQLAEHPDDAGVPGRVHASCAVKKLAVLSSDPIGVSDSISEDTKRFMSALARHRNKTLVVADPNLAFVFLADGKVVPVTREQMKGK
jgi:hypothetical protein